MKDFLGKMINGGYDTFEVMPITPSEIMFPEENGGEKLMVQVAIGKEAPRRQNEEKKVMWLKFSFEIDRNQLSALMRSMDFSSAADLHTSDITII